MNNEFLNFMIFSILLPLAIIVIGGVIVAKIKRIKLRSTPKAKRRKIELLREIKAGNQHYRDKDMYWNPLKEKTNHDIREYIRTYFNTTGNCKYESIKPHLGIIPKLFWFRHIERFVNIIDDLRKYSEDIDDEIGDNKVMFKIIYKEHYDEVEPKEPYKENERVKKFTIQANNALRQYSKILKMAKNLLFI